MCKDLRAEKCERLKGFIWKEFICSESNGVRRVSKGTCIHQMMVME
jgi:hypothetical protein